jgi:hypothetical protein
MTFEYEEGIKLETSLYVCVCTYIRVYIYIYVYTHFFEMRSHYVAQAELEFVIFLPPPPECWDYINVLLDQTFFLV